MTAPPHASSAPGPAEPASGAGPHPIRQPARDPGENEGQALQQPAPEPPPTPEPAAEDWRSFGWFLVKLVVLVLLFRTLVFTSFNIPSESMMPRLLVGDYLFAAKWPYGYSRHSLPIALDLGEGRLLARPPERGDIVIFKHPIDHTDYIKRVIGLPGDRVQMVGGQIHLNGQPAGLERIEDFIVPTNPRTGCGFGGARFTEQRADGRFVCRYPQYRETLPGGPSYTILDLDRTAVDDTDPITVPAGMLFLLGDNRDNSQDSRRPAISNGWVGLVPQENLVGRASFMYFSTDGSAQWLMPWTWFTAARWERIGRGI